MKYPFSLLECAQIFVFITNFQEVHDFASRMRLHGVFSDDTACVDF